MDLLAEYNRLHHGLHTKVVEGKGFITFRDENETQVLVMDFYVSREFVGQGVGRFLEDIVSKYARENGKKELIGVMYPALKMTNESMVIALSTGWKMRVVMSDGGIQMVKKVRENG